MPPLSRPFKKMRLSDNKKQRDAGGTIENVPNSTDRRTPRCDDAEDELRDAMPKSGVSRGARRNRSSAEGATLQNAVEGQIEEICRDISVQVKHMRQLQDQADELRTMLRKWVGQSAADPQVTTD
jgi:hypothetical protein